MDVSAEAADLVVKEGLQATETAVKLAGSGVKNVAALLLALSKQDYKVIGQASAARLARDPNPPAVIQIRAEDFPRFKRMAVKEYGVLYLPVRKRGDEGGMINIISTQTYAANLNRIMEELGYPVPVKETDEPKKASPSLRPRKPQTSEGIPRSIRRRGLLMQSRPCWQGWRRCASFPRKSTPTVRRSKSTFDNNMRRCSYDKH